MTWIWAMYMENLYALVPHENVQDILIDIWMTLEQAWKLIYDKFTETGTEYCTKNV